MERAFRPENYSAIQRLPRAEGSMYEKTPNSDLRKEKATSPINRQGGLKQKRYDREFKEAKPISELVEFVDLYFTNKAKVQELKTAIIARDVISLKNLFSEVSKMQPDIADVIDKINNVIIGDNPPWDYLDYFFEVRGDNRNFRKP